MDYEGSSYITFYDMHEGRRWDSWKRVHCILEPLLVLFACNLDTNFCSAAIASAPWMCHHLVDSTYSAEQTLSTMLDDWLLMDPAPPGLQDFYITSYSAADVSKSVRIFLLNSFNPVSTWKLRYSILRTLRVSS